MSHIKAKSVYVIASQGHRRRFLGEHHFQPWVKNVNKLLRVCGFRTLLLSAGDHSGVYYSKGGRLKIIIHKKMRLLNDYFSIFLSFLMLINRTPTLVIVHGLPHYMTLASLVVYGLLKRTPLLILVHGIYENSNPITLLKNRSIKFLFKLFGKTNPPCLLLSLTHYDKICLTKKWGFMDTRVIVSTFPLFISLDEIRALSNLESTGRAGLRNQCSFLYLGRLSAEKGIDKIILALYKILKKGYKAQLTIVGGGSLKRQIISLVERLRLDNVIKVEGAARDDQKWNFYLESDVLVLASKHEGFPRVILEAFAAGKSVVVPHVCGIPEVVTHGINGFVFKNEEELVECMVDCIEKTNLIRSIGKNNKKIVMERMILETSGLESFSRIISQMGICAPSF